MRVRSLAVALLASVSFACGSGGEWTAPPAVELTFGLAFNPDASGGLRSSTTVSVRLAQNELTAGAVLHGAEFGVYDSQGEVLVIRHVEGPLPFGADGTIGVQQQLDWTPADAVGRALSVRLWFLGADHGPITLERRITF